MFGRNDFKGSTWPSGGAMNVILNSPNQHDIIRAVMDDTGKATVAVRDVTQKCSQLLTTTYHPDSSWTTLVAALDSEFGRPNVQAVFDRIAQTYPEIAAKFDWTKEELRA